MTEQHTHGDIVNMQDLFRPLDDIVENAPALRPLWGIFLFKKAISSVVGDPGAGKSTFGYGLGSALCLGQPFLGIDAEEPVNLLYMDFESSDALIKSRKLMVMQDTKVPNFYMYNIADYYFPQIMEMARQFVIENNINLVVVDNQSMAFNTRDENDNAEAIKQMKVLRTFVNATDTAMILFHHTSKGNLSGTRKGTGAFARARLADICINLDVIDEDNSDIIRIESVKNRMVDDKLSWYLKKEAGQFIITEPPLGFGSKIRGDTQIYKVQQAILDVLENGHSNIPTELFKIKRQTLIEVLPQFETRVIDEGIDRLKRFGKIYSPSFGWLSKKQFT